MAKSKVQISETQKIKAEEQIKNEMRVFDYDTSEYPIEVIVQKYLRNILDDKNEIFVPDYQREYVWEPKRKSKFIESLLMGIPIPYIFLADVNGRLEIVDGSQRIRTLVEFLAEANFLTSESKDGAKSKGLKELGEGCLVLNDLKRLTELNGFTFNDLPKIRQDRFKNKSLRFIILSEKTDVQARQELFERINTGSDELYQIEIIKGSYSGNFYKFIKECAKNELFKTLCPISEKTAIREEGEMRVLRFFAYSRDLDNYEGQVKPFIEQFMDKTDKIFGETLKKEMKKDFIDMLNFVKKHFPYGFKKDENTKSTPRVRFEAIALGVNIALKENTKLAPKAITSWLNSDEFKHHTRSDAANNRTKVVGRIEYVKKQLLGI